MSNINSSIAHTNSFISNTKFVCFLSLLLATAIADRTKDLAKKIEKPSRMIEEKMFTFFVPLESILGGKVHNFFFFDLKFQFIVREEGRYVTVTLMASDQQTIEYVQQYSIQITASDTVLEDKRTVVNFNHHKPITYNLLYYHHVASTIRTYFTKEEAKFHFTVIRETNH